MAVYAIGDLQGCYDPLARLLERLRFDPAADHLWFAGDLVNRGPQSLACLRFVRSLGPAAITVLGNHDLHLVAVHEGYRDYHPRKDSFRDVLEAPDRGELVDWLRHRPLLHSDAALNWTLIHAGLPPQWSVDDAAARAHEVETALRAPGYRLFLEHMYGNEPARWSDALRGHDRLRCITNAFTRLRYCDAKGNMALKAKGAPGSQPPGTRPWFRIKQRRSAGARLVFGHWSTLGRLEHENVYALDTGCVWGGSLSALRLDGPPLWAEQPCAAAQDPLAFAD